MLFFVFFLFRIISVTPFNNIPESSTDLIIFIMSSISSFDIVSIVVPESKILLCISASAVDAAAVIPNGIKTLIANVWITFFINGKLVLSNRPRSLPRNPPYCTILDNWAFDSLILTDELFTKAFRRFATCLLANDNLCGKLI